ncbi:MAG: hypothetical protein HeimC3_18680 [Candidatus Heimdallarchaeota archaeon LC_3]|nr:MAG: hypothetical protein HeimC3_18680 [Candidatus Heimdallarchaeota archaeon LC_3]
MKYSFLIILAIFLNLGLFSLGEFPVLNANQEKSKFITNKVSSISDDIRTWKFITQIEIKERIGNDLEKFPIKITLNLEDLILNNKLEPDGSDLRFTTLSGNFLDFWIENDVNTNATDIWVEISLLKGNKTTIINMYYGNSEIESESDGTKVFDYFDGFEDRNLNEYSTEINGEVPYTVSDHDAYSGNFTLAIGPSSCGTSCFNNFQVKFNLNDIDLPDDYYEISYWRREPYDHGGETRVYVNGLQRYSKNGAPTWEDKG